MAKAEKKNNRLQNIDLNPNTPNALQTTSLTARRQFLRQTLAVTSAIALSDMLPLSVLGASPQTTTCPPTAFAAVNEIKSSELMTNNPGKLQAVLKVVNGNRKIPNKTGGSATAMLRYFDGYNPTIPNQRSTVTADAAGPGPTLRCKIGDIVQIMFLNQVKVQDFGGTLDSGEEGRSNGCDQVTKANPDGSTDKNWLPADDKFPNCLHGSSSGNLHFHGTHVTPATTGDNVLVNVRPDPRVTEKDVQPWFQQIFQQCDMGHEPQKWEDLPKGWRDYQENLLKNYDKTAPYTGPGANPNGHGLPAKLQLWPQNQTAIDQRVWPQWYIGSYPNCFQIPKYDPATLPNLRMGQAPGTHWYHVHKHGSTMLNLYNGLSGALIIMDNSPTGYDGKLQAFYNNKLEEKVMVFQQITSTPSLYSATGGPPPTMLVNGQYAPTINMQPGQTQLWRLINASAGGFIAAKFASNVSQCPAPNPLPSPPTLRTSPLKFKQTAQDGVQFAWENYNDPNNGTQLLNIAPANRVDLLVQAPSQTGCYMLCDENSEGPLVYLNVQGYAVNMPLPSQQSDYPALPSFLKDIDPNTINLSRKVTYQAVVPSTQPPNGRLLNQYYIDGKKFEDQIINQVMLLDSAEEWTLINADSGTQTPHPFHIHVNPFQIVEIFDPAVTDGPQVLKPPYVWWDTIAIPAPSNTYPDGKPRLDKDGKQVFVNGYVKFRSRFVDFTGQYVQHCHILEHEDRGMMQLLEVVSNKAILKHH